MKIDPAGSEKTVIPDTQPPRPAAGPNEGRNFTIFLLIFFGVSLFIIKPLAHGMAWGAVFAFLWRPVHKFMGRSRRLSARPNLRASASFLLLLLSLAIPMIYALRAILGELSPAYENMASLVAKIRSTGISPILSTLPDWLEAPLAPLLADRQKVADFLTTLVQSAAGFLQSISAGVIQWTGAAIFQSFIALTTMFFLIRDGERVVDYVKDFVPLGEERERFIERTGAMLNSVAYGVILTVAIQAALGGIAWWIAGLPSAFLASAAMFLFGMFPMGASVIWGPGAIYLIAIGETVKGAALLAWGALVVSTIDNVLRPLFIGGGAPIPTLAIILGISGGIAAWGLLGVFLGPLAIATFLCVLDMYRVKR